MMFKVTIAKLCELNKTEHNKKHSEGTGDV